MRGCIVCSSQPDSGSAMRLTLLGTGSAGGTPCYGCDCPACRRAAEDPQWRRRACSALLEVNGQKILLDAGLTDLAERFPPGSLSQILLTHYHMDHILGLFDLRWGVNQRIPLAGPDDPEKSRELKRHPGILDISHLEAFEELELGAIQVTSLPLNHSCPSFGYCFDDGRNSLAYLTDTLGLPEQTEAWLMRQRPSLIVIDCSLPPGKRGGGMHNDLQSACDTLTRLRPERGVLSHLGHDLESWLMQQPQVLPAGVELAQDGRVYTL
ncbi:metal-dependent hydrolases of the beta-lactamase superfamily I, PhnP protein [endosymbiont of Tevnia jerichonana (vent Tica)]|uniref:Metal-dependent hydrolases of the beta-lactamase superfamily I, PhnP protein n=3 Tax=Gammaproteobacteria TaxID=1236 RepID=G2FGJ4_9GAMM|nr:metal-dependent hydrolases of the beta-lactamase superfamily I, PhnP protein [endosymbiont of Tevnia jerichonana (vent Tica)]